MKAKYRSWISSRQMFTYFTDGEYSHRNSNGSYLFDWDNAEQLTGIKDKCGADIYPGDILKGGLFVRYEVRWDMWRAGFNIDSDFQHSYEVIGNIHENKDLL